MRLADKVALITGCFQWNWSGSFCLLFAQKAKIVAVDKNVAGGEETACVKEAGGDAIFVKADVSACCG
ncbi:MAG: hypothetical protein R3C11_09755 [Planctomycetaceae bacterium]